MSKLTAEALIFLSIKVILAKKEYAIIILYVTDDKSN